MNFLRSFTQPVIFAHRGASGYAPENTIAAFELAVSMGADAIELDAKLSGDDVVMVMHDQTVDRTTDQSGNLRNFTVDQLKQMDAGSRFDAKFAGERIPTLAEVFEAVGQKTFINVELTNYQTSRDGLVDKVIELVDRYAMNERIIFSSFFPSNLMRAHKLKPHIPAALLCLPGKEGMVARSFAGKWISPELIHPYFSDVNAVMVNREKKRHRRVHVWTVNEPDEMKRLLDLGVQGIFTDFPDTAIQLRG
jgi:glycerophosphoryl diester phosphodiesterase